MLSYLAPDHYFNNFYEISPDFLLSLGCKYLFSDVDNTLAPYEVAEPDERISAWIRAVSDAGIVIVLVSNNGPERIELFNRTLGVRAYADCKKPSRKRLGAIMKELGATPKNTVFLGDQIYTDVLSARRLGAVYLNRFDAGTILRPGLITEAVIIHSTAAADDQLAAFIQCPCGVFAASKQRKNKA